MNSEIKKSSPPLAPLQLFPKMQGFTLEPMTFDRPTSMVRGKHNDITPEWETKRDQILSRTITSPSPATENINTHAWLHTCALEKYATAWRAHEAVAAELLKTEQQVCLHGADPSLLILVHERYAKAVKELNAAEDEWKDSETKV
jgi:hypothetical protein